MQIVENCRVHLSLDIHTALHRNSNSFDPTKIFRGWKISGNFAFQKLKIHDFDEIWFNFIHCVPVVGFGHGRTKNLTNEQSEFKR